MHDNLVPLKTEESLPNGFIVRFRKRYKATDAQDILDLYMAWFDLPKAKVSVQEKKKCLDVLEEYLRDPSHDTSSEGKRCIDFEALSPTKFGGVPNNTEVHLTYCKETKYFFFEILPLGTWDQEHSESIVETF